MASSILKENALLTLDEAKEYLTIGSSVTEYDAELEGYINAVSDLFETLTGRKLMSSQHEEQYDGSGDDTLYLANYPIDETSSSVIIYIDEEWVFGNDTKVDRGDYTVYPDIGKIVYRGCFPKGNRNVKVSYTAGYTSANLVWDIRQVAKEAVSYFRKRKDLGIVGVSSISTPNGGSISVFETSLPTTCMDVLSRYRRE